jgi:hypothetical protein
MKKIAKAGNGKGITATGLANSTDKPRKAPKVAPPSKEKPNYMREYDSKSTRSSAQAPMSKKRLSK